jgi:hypothetical protein
MPSGLLIPVVGWQTGGSLEFRGNTNYDTSNTAPVQSWVMNKPSGVVDGDFLLMFIVQNNPLAFSSTPSGWTLIQDSRLDHSGANAVTYYKIASSEPASYTWDYGATFSERTAACLVALTGGIYDEIGQTEDGSGSTTCTAPSVTVDSDGSVLIAANGQKDTNYSAVPSGFTEVMNVTAKVNLWLGYKIGVASGASGTASWTTTTAKKNDSIQVAVGP